MTSSIFTNFYGYFRPPGDQFCCFMDNCLKTNRAFPLKKKVLKNWRHKYIFQTRGDFCFWQIKNSPTPSHQSRFAGEIAGFRSFPHFCKRKKWHNVLPISTEGWFFSCSLSTHAFPETFVYFYEKSGSKYTNWFYTCERGIVAFKKPTGMRKIEFVGEERKNLWYSLTMKLKCEAIFRAMSMSDNFKAIFFVTVKEILI